MKKHLLGLGLFATAAALSAGFLWSRQNARQPAAAAEPSLGPREEARPRPATRRERYLASLEREVMTDAPPPSSQWSGSASFEDQPLEMDDDLYDEVPVLDEGPISEGPLTQRSVSARPHAPAPSVQAADDDDTIDADSLAEAFLARAIDNART